MTSNRCNICEKMYDTKSITNEDNHCFCNNCYIWLTTVPESFGPMCSNCEMNEVAKTHLCGFNDWCEHCDRSLWSTAEKEISNEMVTISTVNVTNPE